MNDVINIDSASRGSDRRRGDAMGGGGGWHSGALEPGAPQMKRELQWKNWLTRASLLPVKVVIVNCNSTVVVVSFVQCP